MDKLTVLECANRVVDVVDLPFYTELIDTLTLAQNALTHSKPRMDHYPETIARHDKALREVNSVLLRFNQSR